MTRPISPSNDDLYDNPLEGKRLQDEDYVNSGIAKNRKSSRRAVSSSDSSSDSDYPRVTKQTARVTKRQESSSDSENDDSDDSFHQELHLLDEEKSVGMSRNKSTKSNEKTSWLFNSISKSTQRGSTKPVHYRQLSLPSQVADRDYDAESQGSSKSGSLFSKESKPKSFKPRPLSLSSPPSSPKANPGEAPKRSTKVTALMGCLVVIAIIGVSVAAAVLINNYNASKGGEHTISKEDYLKLESIASGGGEPVTVTVTQTVQGQPENQGAYQSTPTSASSAPTKDYLPTSDPNPTATNAARPSGVWEDESCGYGWVSANDGDESCSNSEASEEQNSIQTQSLASITATPTDGVLSIQTVPNAGNSLQAWGGHALDPQSTNTTSSTMYHWGAPAAATPTATACEGLWCNNQAKAKEGNKGEGEALSEVQLKPGNVFQGLFTWQRFVGTGRSFKKDDVQETCGKDFQDSDFVVTISRPFYQSTVFEGKKESTYCTEEVVVSNADTGKSLNLQIVGECPGCKGGYDLGLSEAAFELLSEGKDSFSIKWGYTDSHSLEAQQSS